MMAHIFTITAIAAITSTTTLSLTHHLLTRPWCMNVQTNGQQDITYGQGACPSVHYSHSMGHHRFSSSHQPLRAN